MAARLALAVLVLVVALLVATPLRVHVFIALLLLYALAFVIVNRQQLEVTGTDKLVMLVLCSYAIGHLPGFVMSDYSWRYLAVGLHMVALIPIYLMLRMVLDEGWLRHYRNGLEWSAVAGAMAALLLALYQVVVQGNGRADGFLFHINFGYLVASLFFLLVAMVPSSARRGWLVAGATAALVATALSTSRGALFAVPLVAAFLVLLHWRHFGARRMAISAGAFTVVAVLGYLVIPQVEQRVDVTVDEVARTLEGDYSHNSAGGRVRLWAGAIAAFQQNPWVGLTYDDREALNARLADDANSIVDDWTATISRGHAHSQYFEVMATGGVVGLVALAFYLLLPGLYFLRGYLVARDNPYHFIGLLFSAGFIVFCLSEVALQHEMIGTYYAFMLLVLYVMAQVHECARAEAPSPVAR
ncbi:hypothetical protein BWR19_08440 [Halomonas sp. 1513]|nr:hypothetical protein BWR19_08440 [Halomonas sp. 1513]